MIRKYRYGTPFDTEALTEKIETTEGSFSIWKDQSGRRICFYLYHGRR